MTISTQLCMVMLTVNLITTFCDVCLSIYGVVRERKKNGKLVYNLFSYWMNIV